MPFQFNEVDNQLQDKANIFAPTTATTDSSGAPAASPNLSSGSGSSSGVSASGGAGSAAAAKPKVVPGTGSGGGTPTAAMKQKAYDQTGAGNWQAPTDKIQGTISSANDKLQSEANSYTAKANTTAEGYKVDDATLGKAADGDNKAYQTVASRLSTTQPTSQFDAFEGLKADDIPTAASAVAKPSIFGDIYRPTAGAQYSNGENSLNSLNLRRSGDFRNVALQLGQAQTGLEDNNAKMQDELTTTTRDNLGKAYTAATDDAKSKLNTMGETIIKTAKDQELAEEARRQGLDVKTISAAEFEKLKPQLETTLKAAGLDRELPLLNQGGYDLSNFITKNGDVNYTDFIDQTGADKYNRINGLLGSASSVIAPTKLSADYNFDTNGAGQYVSESIKGKQAELDRGYQSQIDALQAAAAARATAPQGDALKNAQDYVQRQYLDQNEGQSAAEQQAEQEAYRQLFNPETNWSPYYTSQGGLTAGDAAPKTWQDALTPQEAAQMNDLATKSGQQATYKAGSSYNGSNYNSQYFDTKFKTTFDRILAEISAGQGTQSGSGITRDTAVNPIVDAANKKKVDDDTVRFLQSLRRT